MTGVSRCVNRMDWFFALSLVHLWHHDCRRRCFDCRCKVSRAGTGFARLRLAPRLVGNRQDYRIAHMAKNAGEPIGHDATNGTRRSRATTKTAVTRRAPGRATRQILSGADLTPPPELYGSSGSMAPVTFASRFLIALAVLVIASALIWAFWGMAAATPVLLLLALGLIASWLVL